MSTYPTTVDNATSLPYPTATSPRNNPSLAALNGSQNDALIALENKVGTGTSTPTANTFLTGNGVGTSAWANTVPTGTVVGTTDTQTLTNKTLTSPVINTPTINNGGNLSLPTIVDTLIGRTTTDTLTNKTISGASNTLSSIPYAALLSTIFSGQVSTYTNTANAGGTFYYVNLGGIKLLWGATASITTANGATVNQVINLPTGFFSSIQSFSPSVQSVTSVASQYASGNGATLAAANFYITSTGAGAAVVSVWIVGS